MDSIPIAEFLESTYPDPPLPLTSDLGNEVVSKGRAVIGPVFSKSVMPREIHILSPRSQEYFRRTREARLGHPLEDLLDSEREEKAWAAVDDSARELGDLMRTHKTEGPFVLGAQPSAADFFIAGALQCARVVDEEVFQRNMKWPGFVDVYQACAPYMEKKD